MLPTHACTRAHKHKTHTDADAPTRPHAHTHGHTRQVLAALWKAVAALTRLAFRSRLVLRSTLGQDWLLPLAGDWTSGAKLMQGDQGETQRGAVLAGAGGAARDSVGACQLEVLANMAGDGDTCRALLPHGLVLTLAAAASAARARHVIGARTCARGLYYAVSNSPLDQGQDHWHAWWPAAVGAVGAVGAAIGHSGGVPCGSLALLHLAAVFSDAGARPLRGHARRPCC